MEIKKWKTITIGLNTLASYKQKIDICSLSSVHPSYLQGVIEHPTFVISKTKKEIDLVRVTLEELGFKINPTYEELCKSTKAQGLTLCPHETGLALALIENQLDMYHKGHGGNCLSVVIASESFLERDLVSGKDVPTILGLVQGITEWSYRPVASDKGTPMRHRSRRYTSISTHGVEECNKFYISSSWIFQLER